MYKSTPGSRDFQLGLFGPRDQFEEDDELEEDDEPEKNSFQAVPEQENEGVEEEELLFPYRKRAGCKISPRPASLSPSSAGPFHTQRPRTPCDHEHQETANTERPRTPMGSFCRSTTSPTV